MPVPNAQDIVELREESVARFIRDHARDRTLSVMMKRLNTDLMSEDVASSAMAARALRKLGFPLRP